MLSAVRQALRPAQNDDARRASVFQQLVQRPRGIIPARAQVDGAERVALFRSMAEKAQASCSEVLHPADVPNAVAAYLRSQNLPSRLRCGTDPRLAAMPWHDTALEVALGPSDGRDPIAVSHAFAGVAETGTLVLVSGADNPSTLNMLPDTHLVVVCAADIVGDYETVWERIRNAYGHGKMPRTVNWITGPSRSGDIEQTILLGAHGPRRLHLILVLEREPNAIEVKSNRLSVSDT